MKQNMKQMVMVAATAAILGVTVLVPSIEAAVTVTNVTCKQHYPWNGLVDIDYEIVSDQPEAKYWVYPKGTDNRIGKRVIMNTLSGDGATNFVGVGKHRMVWDAKADMPRFHTPDLTVTIQAISDGAKYLVIDISGGTNAVTYPVAYSSTPPDVRLFRPAMTSCTSVEASKRKLSAETIFTLLRCGNCTSSKSACISVTRIASFFSRTSTIISSALTPRLSRSSICSNISIAKSAGLPLGMAWKRT